MRAKLFIPTVVLVAVVACVGGTVFAKGEDDTVYTTLDVKQDYEIVQVIAGYAQIEPAMVRDPFEVAQGKAWQQLAEQAAALDADAVVGIRMEFENLTRDTVGRLIVYGTAVKFAE